MSDNLLSGIVKTFFPLRSPMRNLLEIDCPLYLFQIRKDLRMSQAHIYEQIKTRLGAQINRKRI